MHKINSMVENNRLVLIDELPKDNNIGNSFGKLLLLRKSGRVNTMLIVNSMDALWLLQ